MYGDEVNIMEPFSHLCNDWIGIAICIVFCPRHHQIDNDPVICSLSANGKYISFIISICKKVALSDHIWLMYLLHQYLEKEEQDIKSLWEYDANGFREIGIKIDSTYSSLVKKCRLRVVYKKDIEDLNKTMAQCSNNSIIPYKGLDIPHHYFDNLAVVVEGNQKD